MKGKDTRVHLVEELQRLPKSKEIDEMIEQAKAGEYHDFKNNKYACVKIESYKRLNHLGFQDLANRIREGEFDESPDEDDRKMLNELMMTVGK